MGMLRCEIRRDRRDDATEWDESDEAAPPPRAERAGLRRRDCPDPHFRLRPVPCDRLSLSALIAPGKPLPSTEVTSSTDFASTWRFRSRFAATMSV